MPFNHSGAFYFAEASIVANAPSSSGVYGICNKDRWIYVGESNDVRRRLLEHFRESATCIWKCSPNAFVFELASSATRVQRQDSLILELKPACNQKLG